MLSFGHHQVRFKPKSYVVNVEAAVVDEDNVVVKVASLILLLLENQTFRSWTNFKKKV